MPTWRSVRVPPPRNRPTQSVSGRRGRDGAGVGAGRAVLSRCLARRRPGRAPPPDRSTVPTVLICLTSAATVCRLAELVGSWSARHGDRAAHALVQRADIVDLAGRRRAVLEGAAGAEVVRVECGAACGDDVVRDAV